MTSEPTVEQVVSECESYWLETGVPTGTAREMCVELESHLQDAIAAGKSVRAVVGPDVGGFAEAWAAEFRGPTRQQPPLPEAPKPRFRPTVRDLSLLAALGATIALALMFGRTEDTVDIEAWRWIFLIAAFLLTGGELVTAGFFLLPFAIGAGIAAILAFAGVSVPVLLIVFVLVSVIALFGLQRYAHREDERQHPVGATRYIGKRVIVLEPVSRTTGEGRVRMDTEDWRATTDLPYTLDTGTEAVITEVRGTRMVIVPYVPDSAQ